LYEIFRPATEKGRSGDRAIELVPPERGLHEYLEQSQERLVEIANGMHESYCANNAVENLATE
jgi:hypothetical protein